MAEPTPLDEKLGEVLGLPQAAQARTVAKPARAAIVRQARAPRIG